MYAGWMKLGVENSRGILNSVTQAAVADACLPTKVVFSAATITSFKRLTRALSRQSRFLAEQISGQSEVNMGLPNRSQAYEVARHQRHQSGV
jgi:hypothetical protein